MLCIGRVPPAVETIYASGAGTVGGRGFIAVIKIFGVPASPFVVATGHIFNRIGCPRSSSGCDSGACYGETTSGETKHCM